MGDLAEAKRLFFQALDRLDAGDSSGAEAQLRQALVRAPGHVNILTNLSVALLQQNKTTEAHECAENALAANPDNIEALLVVGQCCTLDQSFPQALAAYDRLLALDPKMPEVHNNRGAILEKLGQHADALASFDRAIVIAPQFAHAHVNRGNALDDPDAALAAYGQALALDPDLAEAWLGRGNVFDNLDRHDDALAAYDKALALRPDLAHAWLGRGNICSKLRRDAEGLTAFDEALALNGNLAEAWLGRGNALRDLGRCEEALADFDKALAQNPDSAEAWLGRGNVFHDLRRHDDALAAYDAALARNATLPNAWLVRADTLRLLGRTQDAVAAYSRALALGGNADVIRYHLAGLGAEPLPSSPPGQYVVGLFDSYADNFDRELVGGLKYRTPGSLANAIRRYASAGALDILDLGCGTGLMGEPLRALKRTLTGVDLSPRMLDKARERNIYDTLIACDLVEFLQAQHKAFDLAVAADVFVYVGELSRVFETVRNALKGGGLFCFSVEAVDDDDFVLRPTLRYAHSAGYLRKLAQRCDFIVETIEPHVIRQDRGADVAGHLAVMRLSS